jgi:hypothetical protein
MIELEIEGLAEALDMFTQGNQRVGMALKRATSASVKVLRARLAKYPSTPSGTKTDYHRTGTLGRKWHSKSTFTDDDVLGFVGNNAPYAPYVQGFDKQARIHTGNWQTDQQVADESRDDVLDIFASQISRAMASQ